LGRGATHFSDVFEHVHLKPYEARRIMENEIRRDYLTKRWVIFAPRRSKRPSDFAVKRVYGESKACAFCRGNENLTPPANLLFIPHPGGVIRTFDKGHRRRSDWLVRCIPNLYPAVNTLASRTKRSDQFPFMRRTAFGFHEIIIESPRHDDHPHRASQSQTKLWLDAAIDRVSDLSNREGVESIVLFRNHGKEAGASIAHAHSQIITTPVVPTRLEEEFEALKRFRRMTGNCALCKVRAHEAKSPRRVLSLYDYDVMTPWASVFPFEFWIIPKRHSSSIIGLSAREVEELAKALRLSLKALAGLLSDPPYNLAFHLAPTRAHDGVFHWHVEVYPKLAVWAGFELGSGMYINTMKPETAARALRKEIG
jgi:UDPglucose--hexose-1-phosphate uridylyltransferase